MIAIRPLPRTLEWSAVPAYDPPALSMIVDVAEPIGDLLKSAREAAGLTVDDVAFRTRLPRSVIQALENEDFSAFAGPVYAKSFLAQYSGFLNVDAQPWMDALEPAAFSGDGMLNPLVEAPAAGEPADTGQPVQRGGWISILGLFALSALLVTAVVKSHEFLENRLGLGAVRHAVEPPPPQPAAAPETVKPEPRPAIEIQDEEAAKPPPRAIIVR